ncbi:MFS transporter [Actinosynnema sp. NPDC053489]|uniref:MFS transporter n=1 Tax=Actinosynnema sp. NPDC053489 TaxID=3363916 RepID=UPI0037C5DFE8
MVATDNPTSSRSGLRLALLALAQFIIAIDYNNVYVALPEIGSALGFSDQSLQWVVSAYAVAFGGLLLLGGRAADRIGARRMFIGALLVFGLSSLVGGLATDQGLLVAARAVQGLGGALLFPSVLALIVTRFPEGKERNRALSVWGATGSGGLAAGALLGGVITYGLGWQWVFFIVVPITILAALVAPKLIAPDTAVSKGSFDIPGALVVTIGVSLIVFGLVSGPEVGWGSIRAWGAIVLGILLVLGFFVIERTTKDPLAPVALFRNRSLVTAMAVAFLHHAALSSGYFIFTIYMQDQLQYNALQAGLAFLPLGVFAMIAGGKVASTVLTKAGVGAGLAVGMIIYAIGLAALVAGMSSGGSYWAVLPGVVLYGFGGGLAFTAIFVAASSGVDAGSQGVASALGSTALQIGAAVGLAIILAIANANADFLDGLQVAGYVAAAGALLGGLLALTLRKPVAAPAAGEAAAAAPEAAV